MFSMNIQRRGEGVLSSGKSDRDMKVTTHIHLVSRLRLLGAISPRPPYVFMGCLVKHRICIHGGTLP
jgi:hypothetical protein